MGGRASRSFHKYGGLNMIILNNFASIYCFIAFIIGALFMLVILSIAAMGKTKEPEPEIQLQFYVKRVHDYFELWIKDRKGIYRYLYHVRLDDNSIIDLESFKDMEYDEMREVKLISDEYDISKG